QRRPPAPPASGPTAGGFPLRVTDDSGRQVAIPEPPRRIVCLSPAHTETLYALGAGELIVGADTYSDFPQEARSKARLNCWPRIPLEQVVAFKPDLVIVLTQEGEELRRLEAAGVRVVQLFPKTYEATLERMALLGRISGRETEAKELVSTLRRRTEAVTSRLQGAARTRVVYELDAMDAARPYVAGGGAIYNEVIRMAGGENLFADQKQPSVQVSSEQVIALNPDVILLGDTRSPVQPQSPARVASRPGWSRISAVKSGRVYGVVSERITRPGPRLVDGLEDVARRLHPELFDR
ncbi:MAG: Periplasmic binding protein, partial [Armatimonadetes bacterium]|nr:Periplasmic binding protein [Armatimonadota bacterium]